jgi:5-methylcytosine-specific restriction endonuclease McrA
MKYFVIKELPEYRFLWFGRLSLDNWLPLKRYVYERDEGICQYCKHSFDYNKTHCHHVLELSEGGTNHPSNLKTLCHQCHKERHPFMLKII